MRVDTSNLLNMNIRWTSLLAAIIILWLLVLYNSLLVNLEGKEILVDEVDISFVTYPLLAFNLVFVVTGLFILVFFLFAYPKAIKRQKLEKENYSKLIHRDAFQPKNTISDLMCSIIIPAHNEEKVIKETISECLLQTHSNIEIIVICHNCTDRTFARCKEETDPRVFAYELNTKSSGKGIALNYGVILSRGNHLLVLDADGRLNKTFIDDMLPMFQEANFAAVQGRYVPSNREYNLLTRLLGLEGDLWSSPFMTMRSVLENRTPLGGTGYMIKKDVLLSVGGFRNHLVDDYELTFRLLRNKYRIGFAPLSINYDEKPPTLNIMYNQRGRWVRGFINLLKQRVAEPRDFLGNLFWVNPLTSFVNLIMLSIMGFSSLHQLFFHFYPFSFAYIPFNFWLILMGLNFVLSAAVLVRLYGRTGFKYSILLPVYAIFTNYYLVVGIKSFFIKSWGESKTEHGFRITEEFVTQLPIMKSIK